MNSPTRSIPIVDIAPLIAGSDAVSTVADELRQACTTDGFFYVVGHGVDQGLQERLEELSREFFAQDLETKLRIRMELGGRAWRGYFPVGHELTSGRPDQKEGIYFGVELPDDHPKVLAGVPLHGRNLFPEVPGFRETLLEYMQALTDLCHSLMEGLALSLNLHREYFRDRYTADPTILFRIFHYPPLPVDAPDDSVWSVGEHTDYGILTVLRQDHHGGLQVKSRGRWIEAPPIPNSFVCNIGDMLDRMTGGRFRSTPHRVRNVGSGGRCSFPFFFDPNWDAEVRPIDPHAEIADDAVDRWDGTSLHNLQGTYGEYLLQKVSKVFPDLGRKELGNSIDGR